MPVKASRSLSIHLCQLPPGVKKDEWGPQGKNQQRQPIMTPGANVPPVISFGLSH